MHRIDTKTAQKDKFGAGKNGFTRGNPQTGTPATDLDDDYFDMLQEELCSVVEASGASLEKGRHDQLLTALRALLLSRKNPFGDIKSDGTVKTALENLGLVDTIGYVGRLLNIRVFTSSGTYTPTPGTKKIRVRAVGGGGGGGGVPAAASGTQATAKGGESGAYVEAIITLETTADIIATIGTGGAGGAAGSNTGVDGGATTLGSLLTCPGGKGGEGGSTNITSFVTSDASSQMAPTTTGTIVFAIGTCRPSLGRIGLASASSVGGAGGSSIIGFGGGGGTVNTGSRTESVSGAGFGAGGGGGSSCVGSAAMAGAAGTSGAILIEEFA